jgi:hypothetical protein
VVLAQKQTWRWMEQNRGPDTNSHLIFNNGAQNMCWRKDIIFNKWF